jgi:hypothetical protein
MARGPSAPNRTVAYVAVVALLVSAAMTGAVLFFQATEHAVHVHQALTGWEAALPVFVDWAGFVAIVTLAAGSMLGYGLLGGRTAASRRVHRALGWTVAALLALHGVGGLVHSLQGVVEAVPISLDVIGIAIAAMLAAQLLTGYGRSKGLSGRASVHAWVGVAVIAVVATHGLVGVWHLLTG